MITEGTSKPLNNNSLSFASSVTFINNSTKLPAKVINVKGFVFLPFSIKKPLACNEKLPDCGFNPA
jgi:hypothetical protein